MTTENPFYYNPPVQPSDFVGRWELVDTITRRLTGSRAASCAVIGSKRFGKSSTLRAIEYRLLDRWQHLKPGERHVLPCVVDFKRCKNENEETVYASILRALYRELECKKELELSLTNTDLYTLVKSKPKSVAFDDFEDALGNLCQTVEECVGSFRLVLLLDEGEFVITHSWAETLFSNLRSMIHDGRFADQIQLVLTGSTRVIQVREKGSPLLNAIDLFFLQALPTQAIQELINRAGNVPEEVCQSIQIKSGGHPFMAQFLLHHLWETGIERISSNLTEQIATKLRQERGLDMQGWWEAIGESGKRAYALLVQTDNWPHCEWVHENTLLDKLRGTAQPLDQALTGLCYHGFAIRDESLQQYRAVNVIFRDWLIHNALLSLSGIADTHAQAVRLHWLICQSFNLEELRTMCFELKVIYDDLGGEGLSAKTRELILHLQRHRGTLEEVATYVANHRPHLENVE